MASISIEIDGVDDLNNTIDDMISASERASDGLLLAVNSRTMPQIESASTIIWNVVTGRYSNSWEANKIDEEAVMIKNPVDYSVPLEHGWVLRNGKFKFSPGVLFPTVLATIDDVAEAYNEWLKNQARL